MQSFGSEFALLAFLLKRSVKKRLSFDLNRSSIRSLQEIKASEECRFPEPEEPIIASALPSSSEKLTSLRTLVLPKCFQYY